MRFSRSNLSKLRSRRASIDRRFSKAEWRLAEDPMANTVHLSEMMDKLAAQSAELSRQIDDEQAADERRALRQALLANCQ